MATGHWPGLQGTLPPSDRRNNQMLEQPLYTRFHLSLRGDFMDIAEFRKWASLAFMTETRMLYTTDSAIHLGL